MKSNLVLLQKNVLYALYKNKFTFHFLYYASSLLVFKIWVVFLPTWRVYIYYIGKVLIAVSRFILVKPFCIKSIILFWEDLQN